MNTIVVLFVTVCLGGGEDTHCEEFGVQTYTGQDAYERCVEDTKREVQVSEIEGTVQTWQCVDVTDNSVGV